MTETSKLPLKHEKTPSLETGWTALDRLRAEMERLFEDFGRGLPSPFQGRGGALESSPLWRMFGAGLEPVVDFVEAPDRYRMTVELPGMTEKDVQVKLSNGSLVIAGEKKEEREEKGVNRYMSERRFGSFTRSFPIPDGVDANRIEATFKDGVLTVTLPKTEDAKKETTIAVKAA